MTKRRFAQKRNPKNSVYYIVGKAGREAAHYPTYATLNEAIKAAEAEASVNPFRRHLAVFRIENLEAAEVSCSTTMSVVINERFNHDRDD